jgi:hypothetical protein
MKSLRQIQTRLGAVLRKGPEQGDARLSLFFVAQVDQDLARLPSVSSRGWLSRGSKSQFRIDGS